LEIDAVTRIVRSPLNPSSVIYLDVTSTCYSPKHTGVQRALRSIYQHLRAKVPVAPVYWNALIRAYVKLGRREHEFLVSPFSLRGQPDAHPERWWETLAVELAQVLDLSNRLPIADFTREDVFCVADIYRDARVTKLPALRTQTPSRRVAIFHDAIGLRLPDSIGARKQKSFAGYVCSMASFDLVICISQEGESDLRHFWEQYGVPPTQTCIEGWPTEFDDSHRSTEGNFGARKILCVSTLEQRKNHLRLLEAAELLWARGVSFQLDIVGRTTNEWGPAIVAEIDRLAHLGRPVIWQKHISDEALHEFYRQSSFTIYPTLREGFGMPILESLWHCRPCIVGRNGALGEVGAGGGCYFIDQESVPAIAEAMERLLEDRDLYDTLHRESLNRKFRSWDDYTARLQAHLDPRAGN
jgi:glycosyltransferase involved in cell wall biosynthesis